MLHTQTVTRTALGLLKSLMSMPELKQFGLVGGTNLSLRFGHRLSIDLDLFTNEPFDPEAIYNKLESMFSNIVMASQSDTMLFLYINDVKIDMVLLPYPYLKPLEEIDGIRLVSVEDIAATKLSAIARRGVKKDFWDIARWRTLIFMAIRCWSGADFAGPTKSQTLPPRLLLHFSTSPLLP
jgi:hypothetical protein